MATALSMSRPPRVSKAVTAGEPPAATVTVPSAAAQETRRVQSSDAVNKKPPRRELKRLPPSSGGGAKADRRNNGATELAERAAKAWMRRALAKRVATRVLKRSTAADEGSGVGLNRRKVLACCCARLPPGLRCALHQDGAPARSWMMSRGGRGGEQCAEAVAVAPPRACGWAFSQYARWRRHVWMPTRFYLERVDAEEHPQQLTAS